MTFEKAARAYHSHLAKLGRRPRYLRSICQHSNWLATHLRDYPIQSIPMAAVDDHVEVMEKDGLARSYIRHRISILCAIGRWHARTFADKPGYSWCSTLPIIRELAAIPTVLTKDQQELLLAEAAKVGPRCHLAIMFALKAGLRHQEIMHLQLMDFDPIRKVVTVRAKPDQGWVPKTHEERVVPMPPSLVFAGRSYTDNGSSFWLFPGRDSILPQRDIHDAVALAFNGAASKDPSAVTWMRTGLHMLRRTWATTMTRNGVPLADLMKMGGWNKLSTVQKYLAPDRDAWRGYAEKLDA